MNTLEGIVGNFPITQGEYEVLDERFGNLCHYAAWQLKKKNVKNNQTNEPEDDVQELRIALIRAGSYYKRQTYIEECFASLGVYWEEDKEGNLRPAINSSCVKDKFIRKVILQLHGLWVDRRRHGANRQKFGGFQEIILERLVTKHVPKEKRPRRDQPLRIDTKFTTYCKQIIWNAQKSLGKKITRDKSWRTGLVSLSEFDYLASNN